MFKSLAMNLSSAERSWLPWLGKTGKLAMRWGCCLNRDRYAVLESAFEGFAATRVNILQSWAEHLWSQLDVLGAEMKSNVAEVPRTHLEARRATLRDVSELFLIDASGRVLVSTHAAREGASDLDRKVVSAGLNANFLHGPYIDPKTEQLPPSSSRFHDAVTLMFYRPISVRGEVVGAICARVPNDLLGDLIQREAGHIFPESGDNYLFMVKSSFDPSIRPGTALSRSRFEDSAFSLGDNLKQGVRTDFGVVKINRHTEFELVFNDPATGELHPGVRETIRHGQNLFVTYPGYSDYRHIPVIGKGTTFSMPGSPDAWGMMCEGDLEEVYRYRGIGYQLTRLYGIVVIGAWAMAMSLQMMLALPMLQEALMQLVLTVAGSFVFHSRGIRPVVDRLRGTSGVLRKIAEGGGDLAQRLPGPEGRGDEVTVIAQWVNSVVDNLEQIIRQVIQTSQEIGEANSTLQSKSRQSSKASAQMQGALQDTLEAIRRQVGEIAGAGIDVEAMRRAVHSASEDAREHFALVQTRSAGIRTSVGVATQTIRELNTRASDISRIVTVISEIAAQTNMLALNAAIEAARAGDAGRGFSVVADEVRKLAERTAKSTHEISSMVSAVQTHAEAAVNTMDKGLGGLEEGLQLAAAAASEKHEIQDIQTRLFAKIDELAAAANANGMRVETMAESAGLVGSAIAEANQSAELTSMSVQTLDRLMGRFKIAA